MSRTTREDSGFTLLELIVSIAVIGILVAGGGAIYSNQMGKVYKATALHLHKVADVQYTPETTKAIRAARFPNGYTKGATPAPFPRTIQVKIGADGRPGECTLFSDDPHGKVECHTL